MRGHSNANPPPGLLPRRIPGIADDVDRAVAARGADDRPFNAMPWLEPRSAASEVEATGGGTHRIRDLTFDTRVARDGTVELDDKPNLQVHVALPGPKTVKRAVTRRLSRWMDGSYRDEVEREGAAPIPRGMRTVDDEQARLGDSSDPRDQSFVIPVIAGSFDLNDALERLAGNDPYLLRKLRLLDRTRAERIRLAETYRRQDLQAAVAALEESLTTLWSYRDWSPQRRRRALFQLWDECAEEGTEAMRSAGRIARAKVIAFIRRHLPKGSAAGYLPAELESLNQQRESRARFEPYR